MKKKHFNKKNILIFIIAFIFISLANIGYNYKFKKDEISYNELITMSDNNEIEEINIMTDNDKLLIIDKNKNKLISINPKTDTFKEDMLKKGIKVAEKRSASTKMFSTMSQLFTFSITIIIVMILFSFTKSMKKKESIVSEKPKVNFNDIAGNDEAKSDMMFLVDFLKDPSKYEKMGAKLPKGVVLYGPPGTGKTLMAKAVAGEAGVPFYLASGSDFVEMYVGLGAKRVRDLFKQAKENSPSIIFIDEIDAVGTSRGESNSERDQTINALLAELDGFESDSSVIVMAATNRLEDLDNALIRPGRFDRHVSIGLPDNEGRFAILKTYSKGKSLSKDVNLKDLANITIGFSGASLEALMNEASIIAVNKGKQVIESEDIDDSYYKIAMKGSKRIRKQNDKNEIELVAYHEAGHALSTKLLTDNHLHKVTIIPSTSGAGGATFSVPKKDSLISKKEILNTIKILYAGRAAEEILKGNKEDITSGASADIQQATKYIKAYFAELGMSPKFGMMAISNEDIYMEDAFELSNQLYEETYKLLEDNIELLKKLSNALIEKETLTGSEVDRLIYLKDH